MKIITVGFLLFAAIKSSAVLGVDNGKVLFYNLAGTQSQLVQLYVNYS